MYWITTDRTKHRVMVTFKGHLQEGQETFDTDLMGAALQVRAADGHFDMVSDFTDAPLLPQVQNEQAERMIAWCIDHGLRKSANVMGTALQRMQVKRLSSDDERFAFFETCEDAARWLDE